MNFVCGERKGSRFVCFLLVLFTYEFSHGNNASVFCWKSEEGISVDLFVGSVFCSINLFASISVTLY